MNNIKYIVSYHSLFDEEPLKTKIIELPENSTWKDALFMTFGNELICRNCMASELNSEVLSSGNPVSDIYESALVEAQQQDWSFSVIKETQTKESSEINLIASIDLDETLYTSVVLNDIGMPVLVGNFESLSNMKIGNGRYTLMNVPLENNLTKLIPRTLGEIDKLTNKD